MTRQPGLDLLRAIAIVWVMVFHSYLAGYMGGGVLRWSGWMGVDLFFALSGFLIGAQVLDPLARGGRLDVADFYLRRAFRILPAYLVVLAVYLIWPSLREVPGMMPAWQFFTYTLNLFIDPSHAAFSHAWSLCVEEHFYLLFPAMAVLLAWRGSWRKTAAVFALLIGGGMALRGLLWWRYVQPLGVDAGNVYVRLLYYPTWARLDDLLAGVALAAMRAYRTRSWAWVERHANALAVGGVLLTALCMAGFNDRRMGFAANVFGYPALALAMMALVGAAGRGRGVLARLHIPGAQWLALASFSLYLTHKLVYAQLHGRFAGWADSHGVATTVLIYVAAVLLVGAALHYAVEQPFLKLRRRVRRARAVAHGEPMSASAALPDVSV